MVNIYKKILLATDGSYHANNAAEQVVEFQKKWNSKVVIFHSTNHHTLPSSLYPNVDLPQEIYRNINEVIKEAGREILTKTKKIFNKAGLSVETRLIEDKDPEDYIKKVVGEENFDLVVLGARGHHSKLKMMLLGTVSSNVIKNAPCDVLVVR